MENPRTKQNCKTKIAADYFGTSFCTLNPPKQEGEIDYKEKYKHLSRCNQVSGCTSCLHSIIKWSR